jgi:hypothetical protein
MGKVADGDLGIVKADEGIHLMAAAAISLMSIESSVSLAYIHRVGNGVIEKDVSSLAIGVYGNWGLLMNQATQASVGTDPWTVIQNRLHPAVAEAEFTPLDWSCLGRRNLSNKNS